MIYSHEAEARERALSASERLRWHQERSGPVMDQLHGWLEVQFAERKVEPNSGLGKAITYLRRHWRPLTLFLRQVGAPLDNNIVERSSKRAVLHRKNALFYRTLNGAQVGDLFMSLIHTCQLCGTSSLDYLVELQRHAQSLAATLQNGCPGTTARLWRRKYDRSTWPKWIVFDHCGATLEKWPENGFPRNHNRVGLLARDGRAGLH